MQIWTQARLLFVRSKYLSAAPDHICGSGALHQAVTFPPV